MTVQGFFDLVNGVGVFATPLTPADVPLVDLAQEYVNVFGEEAAPKYLWNDLDMLFGKQWREEAAPYTRMP